MFFESDIDMSQKQEPAALPASLFKHKTVKWTMLHTHDGYGLKMKNNTK